MPRICRTPLPPFHRRLSRLHEIRFEISPLSRYRVLLLVLLLPCRPGFLDEHAESVDVATSKTDEVSRIDRRQSVAGSCGTIDRIGASARREEGALVVVYGEIAGGLV